VTVTLATPGVAQNTINAGTDTLTSIENLPAAASTTPSPATPAPTFSTAGSETTRSTAAAAPTA
jgi:hypothetical protein